MRDIPDDVFGDGFVPTTGATGWTEGMWSVEDDGSSSYSVPLWVPPGRNGMQPSLALSYNSRRGNGLVGFGWSLDGFSAITPCPRTPLVDGEYEVQAYASADRLCLDGAQLEAAPAGAPGGGDYRVFRNGVVRVDRIGADGFRVFHPDGRIVTYGVAPGAVVVGEATVREEGIPVWDRSVTLAWLASRIEDRHGNAIELHYEVRLGNEDIVGQRVTEYWPTEITYTHGPGLEARRSVRFFYDDTRNDIEFQMVRGVASATTRRLIRIEMWAPTEPGAAPQRVRQYAIDHVQSPVTDRSVVRQIRECDGAGVCREPIEFHSTRVGPIFLEGAALHSGTIEEFVSPRVTTNGTAISGRFFGGGVDYAMRRSGSAWDIAAPGDRAVSSWETRRVDGTLRGNDVLVPFDYDGDGTTELLRYFHETAGDELQLALVRLERTTDGQATSHEIMRLEDPCLRSGRVTPALADLDGDGLTDLIHGCTTSNATTWRARMRSRESAELFGPFVEIAAGERPEVAFVDANGDGRTDVVVGDRAYGLLRGETEFSEISQRPPTSELTEGGEALERFFYFDVNGDGLSDAVSIRDVADLYVRLNTGEGFMPPAQIASESDLYVPGNFGDCSWLPLELSDFRFVDLDHDGRLDLVAFQDMAPNDEPIAIPYTEGSSPEVAVGVRDTPECAEGQRLIFYRNHVTGFVAEIPPGTNSLGESRPYTLPGLAWYFADDGGSSTCSFENGPARPCSRGWFGTHLLESGDQTVLLTGVRSVTAGYRAHRLYRAAPDMVIQVDRGGERDVSFNYDIRAFTRGSCRYPDRCGGQVRVVAEHTDEHGTAFTHDYQSPVTATNGEGWLGFEWHQIRDDDTTHVLTRQHDVSSGELGHPFARFVSLEIGWVRDSVYQFSLYAETRTTRKILALGTGGSFTPVVEERVETWDMTGDPWECNEHPCLTEVLLASLHAPLTRDESVLAYRPATGAIESVIQTNGEDETRTTTFGDHDDRPATWQFNLPRTVTVVGAAAGRISLPLTTSYTWTSAGRPETISDGLTTTTIEYEIDTGLPKLVGVTGADIDPRKTRFQYDADERMFPEHRWNSLDHEQLTLFLPATGAAVYALDPAGVETKLTYDRLGRPRSVSERGVEQQITYEAGPVGTVPAFETIGVRIQAPGGLDLVEFADRFGRTHERRRVGWSGDAVEQFVYDARGRPQDHHLPNFGDPDHRVEHVVLDQADRPRMVHRSFGREWTYTQYDGLTETTLSQRGDVTGTVTYDAAGRVAESYQVAGDDEGPTVLSYEYGPLGALEAIVDQRGHAWRTEYDRYMRPVGSFDPDSGWTCFARDALGQITHELDGAEDEADRCETHAGPLDDAIAVYHHDVLGRLSYTEHRDDGRTEFVWDITAPGLFDSAIRDRDRVTTTYGYDEQRRVGAITTTIEDKPYRYDYGFDEAGRLETIEYPETGGSRFRVRYSYDDARGGAVDFVWGDSASVPMWSAGEYDAYGRVRASSSGQAMRRTVEYDPFTDRVSAISSVSSDNRRLQNQSYFWTEEGNLYQRDDAAHDDYWVYEYDRRHRLTGYGDKVIQHTFDYDDLGNAIEFDGVVQRFDGVHPHRITGRGTVLSGYASHDDQGRRIGSADGFSVHGYNQFDLPSAITQDGVTASFRYDAFGQRVERSTAGASTITVGAFEQRDDGTASMRVSAAGEVIAEVVSDAYGERHILYVGNDHLGSPEVVVDEYGVLQERYQFSAFGTRTRIAPDGGLGDPSQSLLTSGFTGHEQEDDLRVIDMGGRFYDPTTGQFLTQDPIIHSALDRDSFNSYTYTRNNPLRYTDPTGLDWCTDFFACAVCDVEDYLAAAFTAGLSTAAAWFGSRTGSAALAQASVGGSGVRTASAPPPRLAAARDEVAGAGGTTQPGAHLHGRDFSMSGAALDGLAFVTGFGNGITGTEGVVEGHLGYEYGVLLGSATGLAVDGFLMVSGVVEVGAGLVTTEIGVGFGAIALGGAQIGVASAGFGAHSQGFDQASGNIDRILGQRGPDLTYMSGGERGGRPRYHPNAAHNPRSPSWNPNKTPEPTDARAVWDEGRAIRDPDQQAWYARNGSGDVYRFSESADGTVHFSGSLDLGPRPLRADDIDIQIRRQLGRLR